MLQFRDRPIFVTDTSIPYGAQLPGSALAAPFYVPPARPGVGGTAYENSVIDVLNRIERQAVGHLLLSLIPVYYPVLIVKMTDEIANALGTSTCNAATIMSRDTIPLPSGKALRGYSKMAYTPNDSQECRRGPGTRPDEALFHELVHAYHRAMHGGLNPFYSITGTISGNDLSDFGNLDEFQSILVANMYISEYSSALRRDHKSSATLPPELSTSRAYCDAYRPSIKLLAQRQRRLMNLLSFLTEPRFNPLREYFSDERRELYPTDFLPQ
jgi:hypothetical protein